VEGQSQRLANAGTTTGDQHHLVGLPLFHGVVSSVRALAFKACSKAICCRSRADAS